MFMPVVIQAQAHVLAAAGIVLFGLGLMAGSFCLYRSIRARDEAIEKLRVLARKYAHQLSAKDDAIATLRDEADEMHRLYDESEVRVAEILADPEKYAEACHQRIVRADQWSPSRAANHSL